jgi:hypothetical protein
MIFVLIINYLPIKPNYFVCDDTIPGVSHYHAITEVWPMIHCKLQKFVYHSKTNFGSFYNDWQLQIYDHGLQHFSCNWVFETEILLTVR